MDRRGLKQELGQAKKTFGTGVAGKSLVWGDAPLFRSMWEIAGRGRVGRYYQSGS